MSLKCSPMSTPSFWAERCIRATSNTGSRSWQIPGGFYPSVIESLPRIYNYARLADSKQHIVLSSSLDKVAWKTTRIVRDVEDIQKMKQQPGKDMFAVGGATLVSSLMNLGLIDELRLMVNPLILGGGMALFKDVKERHSLKLIKAKPLKSGKVSLTYGT
jgi:dihydrofolate reductase